MALYTREDTQTSKRIYEGAIINLREDTLKNPHGSCVRAVVEHNGGVFIACQPEPDKVILIKQYRYSIDEVLIELPAGRIEIGEDPLPCAQRELIEETGYKASNWRELSRMFTAPGFCDEILYLYLATDITFVGKNLDHDEETEVMIVPVKEAWQLVTEGKIRDAKTIAGLGMLREF
ncbi:MAG: NUDIX hydrolase [Candidatus Obscuribacterales bacterium]|nr:NUDIX hydrolase [Candidatus Obscuribacterales bacterium]